METVAPTDEIPARDPQLAAQGWTRQDELDYLDYMEHEALAECEAITGMTGPCEECGEYSVTTRNVTTLGYYGHPGHEMSGLYECANPDCQHSKLAG